MSSRIRSALSLCAATALTVGIAVLPASGAAADQTGAAGNAPAKATPANVQRFLDKQVPELLNEHNIPGAAVSVVAEGEQVYAGGYGEADIDSGAPVVADESSFPMASVSKSFTATAVLQLVDEGEIDLDANINKYLPEEARVADTYPGEPITMHHLLTHTAGFEENALAMASTTPEGHMDLEDYTVNYQPERMNPPGTFSGYSNYGTTLAGFIVQEVSGTEFNDYLAENVFAPLGMENSAFSAPDAAAEKFDTPTLYDMTGVEEATTLWVNQAPAGAGWATATDMSRFMLALLNGGSYKGQRILSPESAEKVLSQQTDTRPDMAGSGYGSWEKYWNGPHLIGHSGDINGGHTQWTVAPELGLGVYVAVNGDGTADSPLADGRARILDSVLKEFAGTGGAVSKPEPADIPLAQYEGTYRNTRINQSNVSSVMTAMGSQMTVTATGDGRLQTSFAALGETTWTPVEPNVFQSENGDKLRFIETDGEIVGLAQDLLPFMDFQRISTLENSNLHAAAAGAALLVMLTALAWPVAALVRLVRGRSAPRTVGSRTARILTGVAVAFCAGYIGFMGYLFSDPGLLEDMLYKDAPMLIVPLTGAVFAGVGVLVTTVMAWTNKWWGAGGRIHYTLVTLALIVFLAIAANYGLIGIPAE